jgi:tmRNA-binding protein
VGLYDSVSNGIVYYGSEIEELYLDDGSMQETYIYTDGEGLLFIGDDGALHWEDYKENMGENCIFSQE